MAPPEPNRVQGATSPLVRNGPHPAAQGLSRNLCTSRHRAASGSTWDVPVTKGAVDVPGCHALTHAPPSFVQRMPCPTNSSVRSLTYSPTPSLRLAPPPSAPPPLPRSLPCSLPRPGPYLRQSPPPSGPEPHRSPSSPLSRPPSVPHCLRQSLCCGTKAQRGPLCARCHPCARHAPCYVPTVHLSRVCYELYAPTIPPLYTCFSPVVR